MRKTELALAFLPLVLAATPATASVVADPEGDILPTFVGVPSPDLDVTDFFVILNSMNNFVIEAEFAGAINPATNALYIIGVDTGAGAIAPFADIGQPNVTFDQAIVIAGATGTGVVSGSAIEVAFDGNAFRAVVPLSLLPSTGAAPGEYGFNIWPRVGFGNNNQISDFAPENALLRAVPEPSTWLMMLLGFGAISYSMRRQRREKIAQLA